MRRVDEDAAVGHYVDGDIVAAPPAVAAAGSSRKPSELSRGLRLRPRSSAADDEPTARRPARSQTQAMVGDVYDGDRAVQQALPGSSEYIDGNRSQSGTPAGVALSQAPTPSLMSAYTATGGRGTPTGGGDGAFPGAGLYGFDPAMAAQASGEPLFAPTYTRAYHSYTSRAYDAMALLTRKLRTPWLVFSTGMVFVHHFAKSRGTAALDPTLLACAAFSLASKAENLGHVRVARIIDAVFTLSEQKRSPAAPVPLVAAGTTTEVVAVSRPASAASPTFPSGPSSWPLSSTTGAGISSAATGGGTVPSPGSGGPSSGSNAPASEPMAPSVEFGIRKKQILTAELVLLHALDFNVVRRLPYERINQLVAYLYPPITTHAGGRPADEPPLLALTKKLLSYSLMTPLCVLLTSDEWAESLVAIAATAMGVLEELEGQAICRGDGLTVDTAQQRGTEQTMLTCLVFARKRTGHAAIDDLARLHEQRARSAFAASNSTLLDTPSPATGTAGGTGTAAASEGGGTTRTVPAPVASTTQARTPQDGVPPRPNS